MKKEITIKKIKTFSRKKGIKNTRLPKIKPITMDLRIDVVLFIVLMFLRKTKTISFYFIQFKKNLSGEIVSVLYQYPRAKNELRGLLSQRKRRRRKFSPRDIRRR
jgi:hypothetical protein